MGLLRDPQEFIKEPKRRNSIWSNIQAAFQIFSSLRKRLILFWDIQILTLSISIMKGLLFTPRIKRTGIHFTQQNSRLSSACCSLLVYTLESFWGLWCSKTGKTLFFATMTLVRFKSIIRFLQFDTWAVSVTQYKLTTVRDVFNDQPRKPYIPDTHLTVDEQLGSFQGRYPFQQYMPPKPAKYGKKIWWNFLR